MEYYQNYRPYSDQEYDISPSEVQYNEYEFHQFNDGRFDQESMFAEQKNYINYGALRGDHAQPPPGRFLQPANTWHRGHSKYNRCRG